MKFSPDSKFIAVPKNSKIILLNALTGHIKQSLESHEENVSCLAFSPNNAWLASGSSDESIILWKKIVSSDDTVYEGEDIYTFSERLLDRNFGFIVDLVFDADSEILISASQDTVRLLDLKTKQTIEDLAIYGPVNSIHLHESKRLLAAATYRFITFWDRENYQEIKTFEPKNGISQIVKNANSLIFACISLSSFGSNNNIELYDLEDDSITRYLTGHTDSTRYLNFSPDGQTLASSSWDKKVIVWDVETCAPLETFQFDDPPGAIAFSPDDSQLAINRGKFITILQDPTTLTCLD